MKRWPVVVSILIMCTGGASIGVAAAKEADPSEEFFKPTSLHTVHLEVSRRDWDRMAPIRQGTIGRFLEPLASTQPATRPAGDRDRLEPNSFGLSYLYVHGTIEIDGQRLANVALRFKGNSSYMHGSEGLKHPFKIDFNRYIDGQKFKGLTKLNLNNNAFDDSQMRETLSYTLFRQAGLPAPRTTFAVLYLTVDGLYKRECLGVYTLIEEVNKSFLKSHYGNSKGLLLKPELRGRGLVYLGDEWTRYSSTYHPETDGDARTIARFLAFLALVQNADDAAFSSKIGEFLDVDAFLKFLAINTLMANMDSMLATGHNFYLYVHPDSGKIHWIPWDMNQSFGGFNQVGRGDELARMSIMHPWANNNRLLERLLAIETHRKAYREHLLRMIQTIFAIKPLVARIDELQVVLDKAARAIAASKLPSADPATRPATRPSLPPAETGKGGLFEPPRRPRPQLPAIRPFIVDRVDSILRQLDGQSDGIIPQFRGRPGPPGERRPDQRPGPPPGGPGNRPGEANPPPPNR